MGTLKDIYLVLLCSSPQRLNEIDQSIGKGSVSKKRVIRSFNNELAAIVGHKTDGLGIIRVFISRKNACSPILP